jgi:mRNA-degrading endonuclease toxin of MazEF toxin-antitoxin module
MALQPGEIYLADVGEDAKRRILIVSRHDLNQGKYVVAIPFTSADFEIRSKLPNCVPFQAGEFGLTKDCVAQAEAITFVPIHALDEDVGSVGTVDEERMRDVIRAIGHVVCAECEPI